MRPVESFVGQPIRSLQTMLRVISENDPSHPNVVPDGVYGPELMRAVSVFQQKHGLPVTGVTNQDTWDAIVAVYTAAVVEQDAAQPVEVVLNPKEIIMRGQKHPVVYLVQAMLIAIDEMYHSTGSPPVTGILDAPTSDAISAFQSISGLPMTGQLDKQTWKQLALQFTLATNLQYADTPTA